MSYRVSELVPDSNYAVTASSGFFRRAEWRFMLACCTDGTGVACTVEFSLRRAFLFLAPVLMLVGRGAIRQDLDEMKRVVEADSGGV